MPFWNKIKINPNKMKIPNQFNKKPALLAGFFVNPLFSPPLKLKSARQNPTRPARETLSASPPQRNSNAVEFSTA